MKIFLLCWLVAFCSLVFALRMMSFVYARLGGDLGLTDWKRETIIAVVVATLQGALAWVSWSLTGTIIARVVSGAPVLLWLIYRVTHISDSWLDSDSEMDDLSIGAVAVTQAGMLFIGWLLWRHM
jgi:hypothetical protein